MLLFKPQIDRKFCDFCRDLDVIFSLFGCKNVQTYSWPRCISPWACINCTIRIL